MSRSKPQKIVSISNALNRAAHRLKINQKRLVTLAITELDRKRGENPAITITALEFADQYKVDASTAYTELSKACKAMMRQTPISVQMDGFLREINWAEYCDYHDTLGKVTLKFTEQIAPHLLQLESHFTQYKLSRTTGFRSLYSWRLFELLMQFKRTGLLRISTDEFANIMEAGETYRKDFGAMRRKVIEPALKEIKEKDGLDISWGTKKKGRKVVGLEFSFSPEHQKALPLQPPKPSGQPVPTPGTKRQEAMSRRQKLAEQQGLKQLAALAEQVGVPAEGILK
jgi:plasmid replication initiation protein